MKRPGPVGLVIVLTFAIVAAIEFRTLLGMVGVEVATQVYYPAAAVVVGLVVAALLTLPDEDSKRASRV